MKKKVPTSDEESNLWDGADNPHVLVRRRFDSEVASGVEDLCPNNSCQRRPDHPRVSAKTAQGRQSAVSLASVEKIRSTRRNILINYFQRSFTRTLSTEAASCEEREERQSPC
jgi:hypothetical protein